MNRLAMLTSLGLIAIVGTVTVSADAQPRKKKPAKVEPTEKVQKVEEAGAELDRQAAATAIAEVSLARCKATNAAKGEGHVMITFGRDGVAQTAKIDKGPWVGTPVAKCMAKEFKKVKIPAFKGDAVTLGKSFQFD